MSDVQFENENFRFAPPSGVRQSFGGARASKMVSWVMGVFGFQDEKTARKALLLFSLASLAIAVFVGSGVMDRSGGGIIQSPIDDLPETQKSKLPEGMRKAYERSHPNR